MIRIFGYQHQTAVAVVIVNLCFYFLLLVSAAGGEEAQPTFVEPVNNASIVLGRDGTLTCAVDNIGHNKVVWIHLERQMIVAIHEYMVTRIPRYSASHDEHRNTWTLHLRGAQTEDAGRYVCQVNSNPQITQFGIVEVVVPPSIVDAESSASHITIREGSKTTLTCKGKGVPSPKITWRREDGRSIHTGEKKKEVAAVEGEQLTLSKIGRQESGAYLCIASNAIPPSVSKRILVDVEFTPTIHVPNQLVGAPLGAPQVTFECHVESQPKAITYWAKHSNSGGEDIVLLPSMKNLQEASTNGYRTMMKLTIQNLQKNDIDSYRCIAKNPLGAAEGTVKLIETTIQTTSTQAVPVTRGTSAVKRTMPTTQKYLTEPTQWLAMTTEMPKLQNKSPKITNSNQQSSSQPITNTSRVNRNAGETPSWSWCCVVIMLLLPKMVLL